MKLLILLSIFNWHKNIVQYHSAIDTLPPAHKLHAALDAHHNAITTASLAEFDDESRSSWMNWTPSIGIGYAPNGEPRPTASFSLSQVFANLQRNKDRKAKRHSIEAAALIERENAHRQLDQMLQKLELMKLEWRNMVQINEINASLYQLAVTDYETAKIPPSEFLPKKKSYLEAGLNLTRKEIELKNLEMEIIAFSNYPKVF